MPSWAPIVFLVVILKIPVFAGLYLVWYAIRAEPETEDAPGGEQHPFRRWRREPKTPRGPRRGPHGSGSAQAAPDCPPGVRFRISNRAAPVRAGAQRTKRD